MVDAHVHLERGSYCIEWIQEFITLCFIKEY